MYQYFCPYRTLYLLITIPPRVLPWAKNGSPDKYRGLPSATSLEGCTHRLADVGNRVHTRNDSDEDVRGYACKQAIAWKALPWSFII